MNVVSRYCTLNVGHVNLLGVNRYRINLCLSTSIILESGCLRYNVHNKQKGACDYTCAELFSEMLPSFIVHHDHPIFTTTTFEEHNYNSNLSSSSPLTTSELVSQKHTHPLANNATDNIKTTKTVNDRLEV